jgi:beta-galactosidase
MNSLLRGVLIVSLLTNLAVQAQEYQIEIAKTAQRPLSEIDMSGKNPSGVLLGVNNKYFTKNGKPWLPLMGEMHYNRVPVNDWETEIVKMKSLGLSIIASYVFWNEHETAKGSWDWKNKRDLRKFVLLCAKHHMLVWLRIGPWCHGEQLNGGFPDHIQTMKGKRTNDPAYLTYVAGLFNEIGRQTKGLYFKDGGPIIGVQLENEYATGQPEHITRLKGIALESSISPIYWTVTANTVFDDKRMEVIPLQGSYPYRGWEKGGGGPTKDFLYGDDQWIMSDALGKVFYDIHKFPRGLCEQGCGSQMTYSNRFVVEPEIVEAHLQNQIGRGMNLIGYYMFHGGTQTPGLEEHGYPLSYDFQSPVGEFGVIRPSARYLKVLHSFINDFGADLAPLDVYEPANPVRDERDSTRLRYVARSNGNYGFLFLGNTQVRVNMPDKNVTMKVKLANEVISFPPILLRGQTTAVLPFNLKVGAALIKYVTAQPFAKLKNGRHTTVFFQQFPGVDVRMAIDTSTITQGQFPGWHSNTENGQLILRATDTTDITITDSEGNTNTLVFLTRQQTERAWRARLKNQEILLISDADILVEADKVVLSQIGNPEFKFQVYPKTLNLFKNSNLTVIDSPNLVFDCYALKTDKYAHGVTVSYPQKQKALIGIPPALPAYVEDIILSVDYLGGSCGLTQNGKLSTDNLFNGTTWQIGLKRYFAGGRNISLDIRPWDNKTTGIPQYLADEIIEKGSIFKNIHATPKYQTALILQD